ncbi:hypothetical protein CHH47_26035 [Priestia megaterium]|nr:hypothetical protein CHH47_26035 [Priestia megaterium]
MSLNNFIDFFHFLLLDIIVSFLLIIALIILDKYIRINRRENKKKIGLYKKEFFILLIVGVIVYFV